MRTAAYEHGTVVVIGARALQDPTTKESTSAQVPPPDTKPTFIPDRLEDLTASASVWTRALRFEHDRLRWWQNRFGYVVVALSAITGLAAFTQLDDDPAWWATLTVAIVTGIAAVFAAIQTYGNFAVRAEAAGGSSKDFGELLGKMLAAGEDVMQGKLAPDQLDPLYDEYKTLREGRPWVKVELYERAQRAVEEQLHLQKELAKTRKH